MPNAQFFPQTQHHRQNVGRSAGLGATFYFVRDWHPYSGWTVFYEGWDQPLARDFQGRVQAGAYVIADMIDDTPGARWRRETWQSYSPHTEPGKPRDIEAPTPPDLPTGAPTPPSRDYTGPIVLGIVAVGAVAVAALAIRHRRTSTSGVAENPMYYRPTRGPGIHSGVTSPARTGWKPIGWTSLEWRVVRGRDGYSMREVRREDGNVLSSTDLGFASKRRDDAIARAVEHSSRYSRKFDDVRVIDDRGTLVFGYTKGLVSESNLPDDVLKILLDHRFWPPQ